MNVVIVTGRCSREKQGFGIRLEERNRGQWDATWAFGLKEEVAKREGYDRTEIKGTFQFDPSFPGCPYCQAPGLFQCGCGNNACWDGESQTVTCPWCGEIGELSGSVESLRTEGDR